VPDYYLQQMNTSEVAAAETPLSESVKYSESFKVKYKTEMCKNWESTGHCEFEASCSFAHGSLELKQKKDVPKNYKTKLCKRYHKTMYCPYGVRCQFLHGEVQNSSNDRPLLSETLKETTIATKKPRKQVQESDLYSELRKVNLLRQTSRLQIFQQITEPK
jgi:butyrate response factor 1